MKPKIKIVLSLLAVFFLASLCGKASVLNPCQGDRTEAWEKKINEERHPPEKVMDAIGVKSGMIIGEIGAGRGRYTVHLASRVGASGKIYANDINKNALDYLRERCQKYNIHNIEIIQGKEDDPLFPKQSLDMAFMIWVYHMIEKPIPLLKNLKHSLKPGALLVIIDPPDYEIDEEFNQTDIKFDSKRPTIWEKIKKGGEEAGFELIQVETILPKDSIFILKLKDSK